MTARIFGRREYVHWGLSVYETDEFIRGPSWDRPHDSSSGRYRLQGTVSLRTAHDLVRPPRTTGSRTGPTPVGGFAADPTIDPPAFVIIADRPVIGRKARIRSDRWRDSDSPVRFPQVTVTADPVGNEAVDFGVDVVAQFGDERPAALDVVVSNDARSDLTFTVGSWLAFTTPCAHHPDRDETLCLVPDGRSDEQVDRMVSDYRDWIPNAADSDGCWRVQGPLVVPDVAYNLTVEPGEAIRGSYAVLAGPTGEACLPPGDYRFVDHAGVGPSVGESTEVPLAFVVTVDEGQ